MLPHPSWIVSYGINLFPWFRALEPSLRTCSYGSFPPEDGFSVFQYLITASPHRLQVCWGLPRTHPWFLLYLSLNLSVSSCRRLRLFLRMSSGSLIVLKQGEGSVYLTQITSSSFKIWWKFIKPLVLVVMTKYWRMTFYLQIIIIVLMIQGYFESFDPHPSPT